MKIREEEFPLKDLLPGVVYANSLAGIWDEIYYGSGVSLTRENFIHTFESMNGCLPEDEDWEDAPEEEEWLIGDWGAYCTAPDPNGENGYSATVTWLGGAAIVTVVSSRWWAKARMCSPCCPGQANLDEPDEEYGFQCYSLPPHFFDGLGGEAPPEYIDAVKGF